MLKNEKDVIIPYTAARTVEAMVRLDSSIFLRLRCLRKDCHGIFGIDNVHSAIYEYQLFTVR